MNSNPELEEKLRKIIRETDLIKYIKVVRDVNIPNAYIMGGAVRNTVWKQMFGASCELLVNDIDVTYFTKDLSTDMNQYFVNILESILPTGKWETDNQAWVHTYLPREDYWMPHAPYNSLEESIKDYWFSVNTIGIKLNDKDEIEILHPEALPDLFNGILRVLLEHKNNPYPWFQKKIDKIVSRCPQIKVIQ